MPVKSEHDWLVAQYPVPVVQFAGLLAKVPQPTPTAISAQVFGAMQLKLSFQ
jgi:hypothetical protein